jgi:hypothetical protein
MLVELLRPVGPELARRWLAMLLLVPRDEQEALVNAVERRIAETYGPSSLAENRPNRTSTTPAQGEEPLEVVYPPVQRKGYVEQVVVSYERDHPSSRQARDAAQPRRRKGKAG